jgi:hypothetical protein
LSVPGIGWVLAFTIAAEIGEIEFAGARHSGPDGPGPSPARQGEAAAM